MKLYRIDGGNDRLSAALAAALGDRVQLNTEVVAVSHRGREVRVSVKNGRNVAQLTRDYLVLALPATLLRRIPISPALPAQQHEAIARLKYGRGTKTLLQFARRFWRVPGRPRAFGSSLPFGAVWDGNEEQTGKPGILSLLAGGGASDATQSMIDERRHGIAGCIARLAWGEKCRSDDDLTGPCGKRTHGSAAATRTSIRRSIRHCALAAAAVRPVVLCRRAHQPQWQGYMNGAVESGRRAAAEVDATHRTAALRPES